MITISITEWTLSTTDFNTPKVLKNAEAVATLIVRLILMEPGTIQSHPDMGLGLMSNYRHRLIDMEEGIVTTFLSDLNSQIDKFFPLAKGISCSGSFENKELSIYISIDSSLYKVVYDTEATKDYITLTELMEET